MQIAVKGRGVAVDEAVEERVRRRLAKVAKQLSPLARLEVEVSAERNPSIARKHTVEMTLHVKGTTLRACEYARELDHAAKLCTDDLARQVKRHRDKRRGRREARAEGRAQARAGRLNPAL